MTSFLKSLRSGVFLLAGMLSAQACAVTCQEGSGFAWDNATPETGQTIDGTEFIVDGTVEATTTAEQILCEDLTLSPGSHTATVRHTGTVDGQPAVSAESSPLAFSVVGGPPGVGPTPFLYDSRYGAA